MSTERACVCVCVCILGMTEGFWQNEVTLFHQVNVCGGGRDWWGGGGKLRLHIFKHPKYLLITIFLPSTNSSVRSLPGKQRWRSEEGWERCSGSSAEAPDYCHYVGGAQINSSNAQFTHAEALNGLSAPENVSHTC